MPGVITCTTLHKKVWGIVFFHTTPHAWLLFLLFDKPDVEKIGRIVFFDSVLTRLQGYAQFPVVAHKYGGRSSVISTVYFYVMTICDAEGQLERAFLG